MAYIASADLTTRLGATRLANLVNDGTNQTAILAEICTQASDFVDGFLGGRYSTPVTASLGFLEQLTLTVAEWELYRRGSGAEVPEKIRQGYEDTLRTLRDIAAGKLSVAGATPVGGSGAGTLPVVDDETAQFDAASMEDAGW